MGRIKRLGEVKRPEWARNISTDKFIEEGQRMTDQAREARRQYKREWNRKNKDKVKASQARYWEKRAAAAAQDQTDNTQEDNTSP